MNKERCIAMNRKTSWLNHAALPVLIAVTAISPAWSRADGTQPEPALRQASAVTLTLKDVKLRDALISLFDAAHRNYSIDPSVREGTVSLSINSLPFRTALETILRSSPAPLTYTMNSDIVTVMPAPGMRAEPNPLRMIVIAGDTLQTSAAEIVRRMRLEPRWKAGDDFTFRADDHSNSIIVHFRDDSPGSATVRAFRDEVRALDIPAAKVGVKAEVVFLVTDTAGHVHRSVLAGFGQTLSEHSMTLNSSIEQLKPTTAVMWKQGEFKIHVQPVVNGDRTISVDADGVLDFVFTLPGTSRPVHLRKEYRGSDRIKSGSTIVLTSLNFKSGDQKSGTGGELLVFLTPTLPSADRGGNQPVAPNIDPSR